MFKFLETMLDLKSNMFLLQRKLYKLNYIEELGLVPTEIEKIKDGIFDDCKVITHNINLNLITLRLYSNKDYNVEMIDVYLNLLDLLKDYKEDVPVKKRYNILLEDSKKYIDEIIGNKK